MFTLTGSGIRNILLDARLHDPAQLPAQLTFCPAQFASKKVHNFHFFPAPCQKASYSKCFVTLYSMRIVQSQKNTQASWLFIYLLHDLHVGSNKVLHIILFQNFQRKIIMYKLYKIIHVHIHSVESQFFEPPGKTNIGEFEKSGVKLQCLTGDRQMTFGSSWFEHCNWDSTAILH